MTIREIAETAGCAERTVKRWIAENMPGRMEKGKTTHLSYDEATRLMAALPKKNLVQDLGQLSQVESQPADLVTIIKAVVQELVPALLSALRGGPTAPARTALPAPPDLEPRDALRKLVDGYARTQGGGPAYHSAWADLYREFGYRYHRDIARAAKNRGQSVLEYADDEDIIGQLYMIAWQLYGQKEMV